MPGLKVSHPKKGRYDAAPQHPAGGYYLRILTSIMMTRLEDAAVNWLVEPGGEEISKSRLESWGDHAGLDTTQQPDLAEK
jgi:hypothetical protein